MQNPPAVADYDAFTVTRTIHVRASRSTVWATLTTPEHIARWFGQSADFPGGMHVGATGTFGWDSEGDVPVRIDRFEPETAFDFTWGTPGEEIRVDNATTAHFVLADDDAADANQPITVVTVTETGFENLGDAATSRAAMDDNQEGWSSELDEFIAYTEGLVIA